MKPLKEQIMRFYGLTFSLFILVLSAAALFCDVLSAFSKELPKNPDANGCDYYMCQYEKGNIDTIIIEHAKTCQTVIFGEIHDTVIEGMPSPVQDSFYVISLLPTLKAIGYEYLALEVDKNASKVGHSYDIVRFYEAYKQGRGEQEWEYPDAKPGWIALVREAIDIGYKIRFIDVAPKGKFGSLPRDRAMFEEMKKEIFDKNEKAKVIVYIGANHIGECETESGIYVCKGKRRPLGYFLDRYTNGKNFSVYMGHTYDTPEGCDLFISYFIWDTYHKETVPPISPAKND